MRDDGLGCVLRVRTRGVFLAAGLACALLIGVACRGADDPDTVEMGTRRELFVDMHLVDRLEGVIPRLQQPVQREISLVHDAPWEGNTCGYHTVFEDAGTYRMYYRGSHAPVSDSSRPKHRQVTCYAESPDGIHWVKPNLGLIEFDGSRENNIILDGLGTHNFSPFKDANPDCLPEQRYKALGGGKGGLLAFASADGIHWELLQEEPVITKGAFDSQNLAFWDAERGCYVDYHRGFADGVRAIMSCTSADFLTWTEPIWVTYPEGTPREHLYTNQITPYYRAPQILLGFPKRFLPERRFPGNRMNGLSDGVFMSSRDGVQFHRWREAFLRPGPLRERWVNRNNMIAWGVVETPAMNVGWPRELSLYSTEGYYRGDGCSIRRMSLRLDGFVSLSAPASGGEVLTRPLRFSLSEPPRPRPVGWPAGPVSVVKDNPIHGSGALLFDAPAVCTLPGTQMLGPEATLAVTIRSVPTGHRRLFSAYDGGPLEPGGRELVFDLFVGTPAKDGSLIRFSYDGVMVAVPREAVPDWADLCAAAAPLHVAATYSRGAIVVYLNGRAVASGGESGAGDLLLALGDLRFAEDYPPTSRTNEPFLGMADDILVLRRALGGAEMASLAAGGALETLDVDREAGILYTADGEEGDAMLRDMLPADGRADIPMPGGLQWGTVQLLLNYATAAAGSLRCELQTASGEPIPGFSLSDSEVIFGDHVERPVSWGNRTELKHLAGQAIRIRFELRDADLFAIRFGQPEAAVDF